MTYRKYELIVDTIEGTQTIDDVQERLKINRAKAIYLLYKLKKLGYVKTKYLSNKKRLYSINPLNKQEGISYLEAFNEYMPNSAFKINDNDNYFVHGRKIKAEELVIYALKKGKIRYVISSLILFRKIENWAYLYRLAKKEELARQISALYEIARIFIKKVRRMPKRFKSLTTPKKNDKYLFVIQGFKSDDFKDIERKWKVYIPINRADLREYELI